MIEHTFVATDPRNPIDRHFCRTCGLHRSDCRGNATTTVYDSHGVPLPPEPPEDY